MSDLTLTPNIKNADDFYATLLAAHDGLTKHQSDGLNARLVLILSNHIGNMNVLEDAIATARATG